VAKVTSEGNVELTLPKTAFGVVRLRTEKK
jgi:hypothetical protein